MSDQAKPAMSQVYLVRIKPIAEVMYAADVNAAFIAASRTVVPELLAEVRRLRADAAVLNVPTVHDFVSGAVKEAAFQRAHWGSEHDAGKAPQDWFWLIGYLTGKALHASMGGDLEKAKHHTISTAAALANWHAAITGESTVMRPGIGEEKRPPSGTMPETRQEQADADGRLAERPDVPYLQSNTEDFFDRAKEGLM